jgi:hypothetical protein
MLLSLHRSIFLLTVYLFSFFLLIPPLEARWATEGEANIECLQSNITYKIDRRGRWVKVYEAQFKILNETGRDALSVLTCSYDATRSSLKILEATTSINGKEFKVPKEKIEDKPLASDPLALREERQILIPFQQMVVGSVLHIKFEQKFFKPDIEKYFYHFVSFGDGYLWQNASTTFKSELPLRFKINDPKKILEVIESKEGTEQVLQVKLKRPLVQFLVGESNSAFLDPETETYVSVSTEQGYQRIGQILGKQYQPILNGPLPKDLKHILTIANKVDNEIDCIDTVVSSLIGKLTYLGSWNTAEGHYIPRTLEETVNTGYADCKEYSACAAAILNRLGYKAKVALVQRSEVYIDENNLPGLEQFNHAIVKVIGPSGKTYWIDPTNKTSMADGIYPDNADRPALILDPEDSSYERIPPIDYRHARFSREDTTTLRNDGFIETRGSFHFQGEPGQKLIEDLTMRQQSVIKECIIRDLCNGGDPVNPTLDLPESISSKVQDLKGTYSYGIQNALFFTNHGYAFPLMSEWHKPYVETSQKHEGAIFVGHPETIVRKRIFKNAKAKDLNSLAFSIQTPWLNAKRELFVSDDGIIIIETTEKLKSVIPAKDLKSHQFEELRKTLRKYCDGASVIFQNGQF